MPSCQRRGNPAYIERNAMYNPFDRPPDEEVVEVIPGTAPAAIAGPDRSDRRLRKSA